MAIERIALTSGSPALLTGAHDAQRGLVVIPDVLGISPVFEAIAERLASGADARVAVIEPFPGHEHVPVPERIATGLRALSEPRVLADAVDAAEAIGVDPVAVLGVCIGGMLAMRAAATERFDRVVSLYGMVHVPDRWAGGEKGDALEVVQRLDIPVLAFGGTEDEFIPVTHLEELEAAGAEVHRFHGASHGFVHDPQRPNHDVQAAETVWSAVERFLRGGVPA